MKALGVSLKIWRRPEKLLFSGLKGGHTCFFSAVSMQVAENDFGMIAEIVFLIVLTAWSPGMRQFSKKLP